MKNLQRPISIGIAFALGVIELMAGEYIIASALFAVTTLISNIHINQKNSLN
jgi:hypothetical protein